MKLLIVTQYFWPENFRINDLAMGLVERGHEVTVLTGIPNYPEGRFFQGYGFFGPYTQSLDGVTVKRVPMTSRGRRKGLRLIMNFLSFSTVACLVAPFRCRERYDAIIVWCMSPVTVTLPALVLRLFRRAPVFNWIADLWPDTLQATGTLRGGIALRMVRGLSRFIYRQSDVNLIASAGYRGRLEEMGVVSDRIRYWPSWAEAVYAAPVAKPRDVPFPELTGFKILYAGNIGASQGFETILNAAERLKGEPVHWVILGDGILKEWVAQEVTRRGLEAQVHLLGRCPIEDVPHYAAKADAMLVSLRKEPLFAITVPGKVQSCLAIGRPVIASIDGEAGDIIRDAGAGLVAPADDDQALAAATRQMAGMDASERAMMGRAARAHFAENFDRERLFARLEEWIARA